MNFGLSGLASGFDWKSLVDQLIELERTPIHRLNQDIGNNALQVDRLSQLNTRFSTLQTDTKALGEAGLFDGRTAASTTSGSTWAATATAGTTTGSYKLDVTQLATAAKSTGQADISSALNATDDVSGLTIANLATATAVTAGKFSVNGQQIEVELTDSLQDVFDAISTATGGEVTASYSNATDRITLSGSSSVMLGAANDTSNFLAAMRLANNGTSTISSSGNLGSADTTATLSNARLAAAITAVDGSGDGSFTINGESISYNVNTDTLATVMERINSSDAGVTASYDGTTDQMVLTNKVTGDLGISVSESAGGLLDALGLTGSATFTNGLNAEYTLNGGGVLTSTSNTLSSVSHGIEGFEVTVDEVTEQTITVASNTDAMTAAVEKFIESFNAAQSYIEDQTKITTSSQGDVTTSPLSDNREVQAWARTLRVSAFEEVSGLSGDSPAWNTWESILRPAPMSWKSRIRPS
jgi:flagellar hook-associated protein 2